MGRGKNEQLYLWELGFTKRGKERKIIFFSEIWFCMENHIFSRSAIFMVFESLFPIECDVKCTVQKERGRSLMVATHCNANTLLRKTLVLPVLHADNWVYLYLSVYLICVYRHTYIHTCGVDAGRPLWYSVYLLYWYKSTNTDAEGAARHCLASFRSQLSLLSFLPIMTTTTLPNTGTYI
jgi:hypothetical protein